MRGDFFFKSIGLRAVYVWNFNARLGNLIKPFFDVILWGRLGLSPYNVTFSIVPELQDTILEVEEHVQEELDDDY